MNINSKIINYNKKVFQKENLTFVCIDIATDILPNADCVLIRQVLQHLSNTEIHNIIKKLSVYKYVILTEHIPEGEFIPNIDIISGQGIRLKKQSGVKLLEPPFNFKVKTSTELLSVPVTKGSVVTMLYEVF